MSTPVAIVTGGSGGIGRYIAARLGADGYSVIVHYANAQDAALETVREVQQAGAQAWPLRADLSTPSGPGTLIEEIHSLIDTVGGHHVYALVNNASFLLGPAFGSATADVFDAYFALNVRAPVLLAQGVAPLMAAGGSIVNISSAAAHFASPNDIIYVMTKNATESLGMHAAPALASVGVRINTVIPGFTDNGHPAFRNPDVRAHMSSFAAMGDVSEPRHVADAVSFLVSDASSRTTGTTLDVSGGSTIGARAPSGRAVSLRDLAARN